MAEFICWLIQNQDIWNKICSWKKQGIFFQFLIPDLKSARKNTSNKLFYQTCICQDKILMGWHHFELVNKMKVNQTKFEQIDFRITFFCPNVLVLEILQGNWLQKWRRLRYWWFSIWPTSAILNIKKRTTDIKRYCAVLKTRDRQI